MMQTAPKSILQDSNLEEFVTVLFLYDKKLIVFTDIVALVWAHFTLGCSTYITIKELWRFSGFEKNYRSNQREKWKLSWTNAIQEHSWFEFLALAKNSVRRRFFVERRIWSRGNALCYHFMFLWTVWCSVLNIHLCWYNVGRAKFLFLE